MEWSRVEWSGVEDGEKNMNWFRFNKRREKKLEKMRIDVVR